MTIIAPTTTEPVEATPRSTMTPARRERIHAAHAGLCGVCGQPVALDECEIDHRIAHWISRRDDDANLWPMHVACHRGAGGQSKTAWDRKIIAKIKRIIARREGTRRPRKAIPNRGFGKQHRPLRSRWGVRGELYSSLPSETESHPGIYHSCL